MKNVIRERTREGESRDTEKRETGERWGGGGGRIVDLLQQVELIFATGWVLSVTVRPTVIAHVWISGREGWAGGGGGE